MSDRKKLQEALEVLNRLLDIQKAELEAAEKECAHAAQKFSDVLRQINKTAASIKLFTELLNELPEETSQEPTEEATP